MKSVKIPKNLVDLGDKAGFMCKTVRNFHRIEILKTCRFLEKELKKILG
jgi:hypothetical protein